MVLVVLNIIVSLFVNLSASTNFTMKMKEKLAKRLDMVHSSITKNDKGIKELNCYFESLPLKDL